MARNDPRNRSRIWTDPAVDGLLMMHADFTTHEFAPHVHDELVIALTERGGSEFRSRGVYDNAEPGAVLVFNPGEPHSGRMAGSDGWRYRSFYLDRPMLGELARLVGVPAEALPHFAANKLDDPHLFAAFARLHGLSERPGAALAKQSQLLTALAALLARHGAPAPPRREPGREHAAVARATDYLNDHHQRNVTLAELAGVSGMNPYHLIRSFNQQIGLAPHAYLTQVRVLRARDLLERGTPAAEAAVQVGLYDQSALNRHFKRIYGVTPGQYAAAIRPA